MQSFLCHAVAIVVLGMIVPTSDEAKTPVRLVLAPPAEAEEPLGQESIFIEVPLPVETQSELEPVPLEPPAVELLTVMVEPFGGGRRSMISWQQKFRVCGGVLDVDANPHPVRLTPAPVENVFWTRGRAPFGRYTIAVHHYMPWSRLPQTPVEVAVLVDGRGLG